MIYSLKICKFCNVTFENVDGRKFGSHVGSCKFNPKNSELTVCVHCKREILKNRIALHEKVCETKKSICIECNTPYIKKDHPQKFCSQMCSGKHNNKIKYDNGYVMSDAGRKSISGKIKDYNRSVGKVNGDDEILCKTCKCPFKRKTKKRKFCSIKCSDGYRLSQLDPELYSNYRLACKFKFSLNAFPKEFDFTLIDLFGWFNPGRNGIRKNINGISRDHIVSVKYGFKNGVSPDIISHPANCRLMRQNDNVSKSAKCGMTLDELLEKIRLWEEKYK